jgi:hypothetical protein
MPQRRRSESGAIIGLLARLEAPTPCLAANDVQRPILLNKTLMRREKGNYPPLVNEDG